MFLSWRRQVARQPGAVTLLALFITLLLQRGHCTAQCTRPLRFGALGYQAVMLLAAPPPSSRQPSVSNRSALFIPSSAPLHFTSFAAIHLLQGRAPQPTHICQSQAEAPAFPQTCPTVLTGFHSASLRPPFTAALLCPPAAHNWLAGVPHFGCVC